MDTKLENGDFALNSRGLPQTVQGREEILQQAMIRLCTRRGSLPADPALGSRLYQLTAGARMEEEAFAYAQEALAPLRQLTVKSASCSLQDQRLTVRLQLEWEQESIQMEVTI